MARTIGRLSSVKVVGLAPPRRAMAASAPNAHDLAGAARRRRAGRPRRLLEAAGPVRPADPAIPAGYGFTAIIVAFLGRLQSARHPLRGLVLAVTYVGGEVAQTTVGLPQAATGMFQAMLLFFLLATDMLVRYRIGWKARTA